MRNNFLSHTDAAQRNRNNILHFVRTYQPVSRTDIWEKMDISRASVTQIIRQLQESGLIMETGEGESTGGRKPRYLMLCDSARKFYAYDWPSRTLFLMDIGGNVLREMRVDFPAAVTPETFAETILSNVDKIEGEGLCPPEEVVGLVLSLPGLVDIHTGTVIYAVELDWRGVNIRQMFCRRFGDNVYVEKLTNIMALGEHADSHLDDPSHFQLFLLGSGGIGVATIVHGNCQHGANCMYGELGHIKLPVDVRCSCGQRGCLEAVIKEELRRSNGKITEDILYYLSVGVATSVNLSDARVIVLTGELVEQMDQQQRDTLSDMISQKVTGQQFRKFRVLFRDQTKQLAVQGIGAYFFDSYFPVE